MKVLVVFDKNPNGNPFVRQLIEGLQQETDCEIVCSAKRFWSDAEAFDVIHFQWPEEIFDWHWPDDEQLTQLETRLRELKAKGIKLIYTRHNTRPHHGNPQIERGYQLIEQYADAIAHMGEYSKAEFMQEYPSSQQIHAIIPHHIYENEYDTTVTRQTGRRALHLPQKGFIILAFGAFRHKQEKQLVWGAFRRCSTKGCYLLAPRYFPHPFHPVWHRGIKRLFSRIAYLSATVATWPLACRITSLRGLIPDQELPFYVAAADVVFIQRTDILNSGNVTLGFLFGKVVVGPDKGNIGEVLRQTGNPVFNPESPESVDRALAEAARLSAEGHGERNRRFATENLTPGRIARMYAALYEQLHG